MNRAFRIPADLMEDDDPTLEMELTPAQQEMLSRAAGGESAPAPSPPPAVLRDLADNFVEQAPPLIPVKPVATQPKRPAPAHTAASARLAEKPPKPAVPAPNEAFAAASARSGASRLAIGLGILAVCAFSASVAYLTLPTPVTTSPPPPAEIVPEPASPPEPLPQETESREMTLPVFFVNPFDATEVFQFPPGTSETEARDAVADALLKRARERLDLSSGKAPPNGPGDADTGAARPRLARRG